MLTPSILSLAQRLVEWGVDGRDPIAPHYLMGVIDDLATDDTILTCDSGTIATSAARHWTIRGGREFYLSGNLATMAPACPMRSASSTPSADRRADRERG